TEVDHGAFLEARDGVAAEDRVDLGLELRGHRVRARQAVHDAAGRGPGSVTGAVPERPARRRAGPDLHDLVQGLADGPRDEAAAEGRCARDQEERLEDRGVVAALADLVRGTCEEGRADPRDDYHGEQREDHRHPALAMGPYEHEDTALMMNVWLLPRSTCAT